MALNRSKPHAASAMGWLETGNLWIFMRIEPFQV